VADNINLFILGADQYCQSPASIDCTAAELKMTPVRSFTRGKPGLVGHSRFFFLYTARIRGLGWIPKLSLRSNPAELRVLGNGRQRKSYLYVQDCIDAILMALDRVDGKINIFNLGTDEYCEVNDSIDWITAELKLNPVRTYTGGERGWVGDSPFIFLDTARIRALGWIPKLTIRDGIVRTLEYLQANPWILDRA
jgi:nucleoside-diphosphate-sugar epimerase